jgi:hypothetical protein
MFSSFEDFDQDVDTSNFLRKHRVSKEYLIFYIYLNVTTVLSKQKIQGE